jgi:hypothetical protein
MKLNKSSWYVRWFFWSLGIWDEFLGDDKVWQVEVRGTNLCHFLRVMCVYAPFVLTIHAIVYAGVIAVVTALPIYLFGVWGWGTLVAFGLLIWGAIVFRARWLERPRLRQAAPEPESPPSGPSFRAVIAARLAAQKSRVCPLVTFAGRQDEVRS